MEKKRYFAAALAAVLLTGCGLTGKSSETGVLTDAYSAAEDSISVTGESLAAEEPSAQESTVTAAETSSAAESSEDVQPLVEEPDEQGYVNINGSLVRLADGDEPISVPPLLEEISYDSDFYTTNNAVRHDIAEAFSCDLDGDGTDEVIDLTGTRIEDEYLGEGHFPVINGEEVTMQSSFDFDYKNLFYTDLPCVYTADIDSSDKYTELAIVHSSFTNEVPTVYYRYMEGKLIPVACIVYDTPDPKEDLRLDVCGLSSVVFGAPIITDGSGTITAAYRSDLMQTWFSYRHYTYDEVSKSYTVVQGEPDYPFGYDNIKDYDKCLSLVDGYYTGNGLEYPKLMCSVMAYKEPDLSAEAITIDPQDALVTAQLEVLPGDVSTADGTYFYAHPDFWAHIVTKGGESGWVYVYGEKTADDGAESYSPPYIVSAEGETAEEWYSSPMLYD